MVQPIVVEDVTKLRQSGTCPNVAQPRSDLPHNCRQRDASALIECLSILRVTAQCCLRLVRDHSSRGELLLGSASLPHVTSAIGSVADMRENALIAVVRCESGPFRKQSFNSWLIARGGTHCNQLRCAGKRATTAAP